MTPREATRDYVGRRVPARQRRPVARTPAESGERGGPPAAWSGERPDKRQRSRPARVAAQMSASFLVSCPLGLTAAATPVTMGAGANGRPLLETARRVMRR
jgi:hypothetical protein